MFIASPDSVAKFTKQNVLQINQGNSILNIPYDSEIFSIQSNICFMLNTYGKFKIKHFCYVALAATNVSSSARKLEFADLKTWKKADYYKLFLKFTHIHSV